jgi:hypothetical protein
MLVKVVLSYYMEGEHSQGASNSKGCQSGNHCWGVERQTGIPTVEEQGITALDPQGSGWNLGSCRLNPVGAHRLEGWWLRGLDTPDGCRLKCDLGAGTAGRPASTPPTHGSDVRRRRLGTAGRPWTERLMRLPGRMCPLGMGIVAWLSKRGFDRSRFRA